MERRKFLKSAALSGAAVAAAGAGASAFPTPALSQGRMEWKMVTTWPKNFPGLGTGAERVAQRITAMSDGRLTIKVFGAGGLVPPFESFDAVSQGTAEMMHGASYYWQGKNKALAFFTAVPFGMVPDEHDAWIAFGGGQELWDDIYAQFDLKGFNAGSTGTQAAGWFRKELTSTADFDGLKMRIPGLAGKVYAKLGVNVQLLPGGEIFPALERGVIDAAEFVGPYQDRRLGLQKAAKYYYTTGWHEPNNVTELLINKTAWETLPADLQAIVKVAAMACNLESNAWCDANNAEALEDLVTNFGVIAQPLPEPIVDELRTLTTATLEEGAAADPTTRKVHDAYFAFKKRYGDWAGVSAEPLLPVLYKG